MPPLHQLDLTKRALPNNLERVVVLRPLGRAQEPQEVGLGPAHVVLPLLLASVGQVLGLEFVFEFLRSVLKLAAFALIACLNVYRTSHCEHEHAPHSP